jgi:hypothetical protein
MEDDKAGRPALDSPVVESSLPQVPYPPLQGLAESTTPGPSEVPSNPYNILGDAGSQIDAKPAEKPMSFPETNRISADHEVLFLARKLVQVCHSAYQVPDPDFGAWTAYYM